MRVTMKDVARRAGVSVTTVSLVLNEAPGIAQSTRERVRSVIRELHYVPNDQARRLFSGRTGTLAFVMPPWQAAFADPYFLELMRGSLEALRDRGYEMLLEISDERFLKNTLWKRLFDSQRVDGLLVATPYLDQTYLNQVAEQGYPALLINGDRPDLPQLDFVGYDDERCGFEAAQYLAQLGHRRIGHLSGPENQESALRRKAGYRRALQALGLEVRDNWVQCGEYLPLEARDALVRILELKRKDWPTALFCANDTMALSVIHHLKEKGLMVPGDFSVVGVDDTGQAQLSNPPLTTFRQDVFEAARRAGNLFIDKLESKSTAAPRVYELLPMVLVERSSCAPLG